MFTWAMKKVFGTSHDRTIRRMRPRVEAINALEPELKKLTDPELTGKTAEFKQKLENGATLDDILVPAFAVCREAGRRVLKMRHYDVQMVGGMVLHGGNIAEMKTGEGKTLVATLACYLNALEGKGVHLITVNDYLAKRDAEWMGKLYGFLGLSTGVVVNQQNDADKKVAYKADITYGQNNEFGFDYLRDNMKFSALDYHQRPLHYAIVDEVDSILIDEARTPLIISGQGERSSDSYRVVNDFIPKLRNEEHYAVDEKGHSVALTDDGVEMAERLLSRAGILKGGNLYDTVNLETLHILNQCLRAHTLYKRDVNYMVREGKVLIIDEFTGRVLAGRRWSDGLHQAVEAKENVRVQEENRTMATITFQNLFRLYKKLSGMTGTADTEAAEFHSTYKLDVTIIPTNKPMIREDYEDLVYKTEREKFTAVIAELLERHEMGQPVLVGTTSVEKSAAISKILTKKGVKHDVLNAKHHANEAMIVAQAGRKGAITVSTNMAGRGTDIVLGGNAEMIAKHQFTLENRIPEAEPEAFEALVESLKEDCKAEGEDVRALKDPDGNPYLDAAGKQIGGLFILGTERHESRRIDNQLRGRAGRQGDPGASRFYLSLEDDLMRIFAGDRVKNLMERMGMPDDEPIEHPWVTKSVENAQKKVEERNFDIRKNLLEYDDVMSAQRKTIYEMRQQMLVGRYAPEVVDEDGKPTGERRKIKSDPKVGEVVAGEVALRLGLFCEDPVTPRDEDGRRRAPTREDFVKATGGATASPKAKKKAADAAKADGKKDGAKKGDKADKAEQAGKREAGAPNKNKLVDTEQLVREFYEQWGVKLDVQGREEHVLEIFDEAVDLVPKALTEQRERALDLIDRLIGAMVEESCPPRKPPEDWDWGGIFQGFKEHFGVELDDKITENVDAELLAQDLFKHAERSYLAREKKLGIELTLRLFRHVYLEELDKAWVDHLTDMDHLRDGIGLRGYGQRDPKNEYKKEGYNMFVNMVARVSSNVITKLFNAKVRGVEDEEAMEAADAERHARQLAAAAAVHADAVPPAGAAAASEPPPPAAPRPPPEPAVKADMECPCGSGKPFATCHGAEEEATV